MKQSEKRAGIRAILGPEIPEEKIDQIMEFLNPPRKKSETIPEKSPVPLSVEIYRVEARVYPNKSCWPDIERIVGENSIDIERWAKTIHAYILLGWNRFNVSGMLEFFERGEIPHVKRNSNNGMPLAAEDVPTLKELGYYA